MLMDKDKRQQMILSNKGLIYNMLRKYHINQQTRDYEDYVSIGMIGLIRAVDTFDDTNGTPFSSYASKGIELELMHNYRDMIKYKDDISLQEPIVDNGGGDQLILEDILEDSKAKFDDNEEDEIYSQLINVILNYLNVKEICICFYLFSNIKQIDIAKSLHYTWQNISKKVANAHRKIQKAINDKLKYEELFSIDNLENGCKIRFIFKECNNFDELNMFLEKLRFTEKIFNFKLNRNNLTIKFPFDSIYFSMVADIIKKMDELNIKLFSLKDELEFNSKKDYPIEKINKSEIVRNYILSQNSFITIEVVKKFPNFSRQTIVMTIKKLNDEGLIRRIQKGKYVVEKIKMQEEED